jgi:hypothetical protein
MNYLINLKQKLCHRPRDSRSSGKNGGTSGKH